MDRHLESMFADVVAPFVLQFAISALTVGFSPAGSLLRWASIPLNLLCMSRIVATTAAYMRQLYATGVVSLSSALVLHYVDIALVSRWTYEANPYSSAVEKSNGATPHAGHKRAGAEADGGHQLDRAVWGLKSLFRSRRLNSAEEVDTVPQLPHYASTSRLGYLRYAAARMLVLYLICDILTPDFPPDMEFMADTLAAHKVPIIQRLIEGKAVSASELGIRTAFILLNWVVAYAMMDLTVLTTSVIFVSFHLSSPSEWKPFQGPPLEAYTVRHFWGRAWHQGIRNPLNKPAEWVVEDVIGIKATRPEQKVRRWFAKYAKLIIAFGISGVLHAISDCSVECGPSECGSIRYFLTQATGIVVEDHVQAWFVAATGLGGGAKPTWWERSLGYVWVVIFEVWTSPAWIYPRGLKMSSEERPFLPVSLVQTLKSFRR